MGELQEARYLASLCVTPRFLYIFAGISYESQNGQINYQTPVKNIERLSITNFTQQWETINVKSPFSSHSLSAKCLKDNKILIFGNFNDRDYMECCYFEYTNNTFTEVKKTMENNNIQYNAERLQKYSMTDAIGLRDGKLYAFDAYSCATTDLFVL